MTWVRPSRCESHACPEWEYLPDVDRVRVRSSERPSGVAELTQQELADLVAAWQAGEVGPLS
jgi:hypothetical protein